jgi:RNA polymerase sigma-70 factor (ECF subfamily)
MADSQDAQEALVHAIRQGDQSALAQFIDERKPQLLAFIDRNISDKLRRKVEPADLLQETTISALSALEDVELDDRDPFSWLCQLAERRIIDAHRRYFGAQKRSGDKEVGLQASKADSDQRGFIDILVASMTSASRAFSRGQKEFELLKALEALPEESREALRLRYVENMPSKEIATRLDKTDGATRVLLCPSCKTSSARTLCSKACRSTARSSRLSASSCESTPNERL